MKDNIYETETLLQQYLTFHYGTPAKFPFSNDYSDLLNFPVRCVRECLNPKKLDQNAIALDLGCAVGRSTFELSRFCKKVIGIDKSKRFIQAAKKIQKNNSLECNLFEEGNQSKKTLAKLPKTIDPDKVEFICGDLMNLFQLIPPTQFDVVLAANILCRLRSPLKFLNFLPDVVKSKGQLILISPYSWLTTFTPKKNWIPTDILTNLRTILSETFKLKKNFDLPFLFREHSRKYQYVISQATVWERI